MKQRTILGLMVTTALTTSPLGIKTAIAQAAAATATATTTTSDAEPALVDTVVVSGIRRSLQSARNLKKDAAQIVDAIVADDIGKLPDRNVAESLARVSGVQVDRGIGEGTSVSVRGLRQNVFLFNGREIYDATGRGGVGLDQLGTSTYGIMALVPSELISRLEVTKLAGAEQVAGALGGVVDIRTRMPLEGPDNLIAGKVGASYDQLPGKYGDELFGLFSKKFANNTVGVIASISYDNRKLSQQGLDTFSGYKTYTDAKTGKVLFGDQDVRTQDIQERREKIGFNAAVQWRPMAGVELTADTFVSQLNSKRDRYWLSFNPTDGLSNAVYSPNNILLSGHAVTPVLNNTEFADTKADLASSALRAKFSVTDSLRGSAEASYGRSTSSYHQFYMRLQPVVGVASNVDFDLSNGAFGAYSIGGVNLLDPNNQRATIFFDNLYRAATDTTALRSDFRLSLDAPGLESLEFGARHNRMDSIQNPLRADIRPAGGIVASQLASYLGVYSNPGFASGNFAGLPRSYLAGVRSAISGCASFTNFASISQDAQCLNPGATINALSGSFDVQETMTEAYAKLNYDAKLAGADVSGNVGMRVLDRKMDSIGNLIAASGAATPTSYVRNDREWLPSAVARVELSPQTVVRLGAARVVAFPNTADLNNGVSLSNNAVFTNGVQTGLATGSGGAPGLNPFKAKQVDISLEQYFEKQSMLSLGLFNKDVSSFIIQKQSPESYGGINYLINRKVNGEGATVRGAEMLLQMPFFFLPKPFNDFGIMATYSYIDSSTPIHDATGRELPFPGLSKNNVNLVGYYEAGPFSARLAYNWRDAYLVGLSAANTGVYNGAYTDLSATLRYDINPHFSLNFEANNLRNSSQRTYDGSTEGLRTNALFGRIYKASVNMKF